MPQAQIVRSWTDGDRAYLAVRVANDVANTDTEYIGSVLIDDAWQAMSAAEKRAALIAAAKAERDRSRALVAAVAGQDLGITETVSV